MTSSELQYALHDGKLVHISEVPKGLKCGCVCPSCNASLVAKQGLVNVHHFAHYHAEDCGKGRETALHIMAKELIAALKVAYLPSPNGGIKFEFSGAEIEKQLTPEIRSDVYLTSPELNLNVEILVTHPVDDEKKLRLFSANIPTIEIDLSRIPDYFTKADVQNALSTDALTKWVYNPEEKAWFIAKYLCDYLPLEGEKTFCPMQNKKVDFLFSAHSCHECIDFQHRIPCNSNSRPCTYRLRNIDFSAVSGISNIKRVRGAIESICLYDGNKWNVWKSTFPQKLARSGNDEVELRRHRVCFTGHRPEKLNMPEQEVIARLEREIRQAIADGFSVFISGMARGVDIWAAEIVLKIRSEGLPIRLICASPYNGFERSWSADWQKRYSSIMREADLVRFICPQYSRSCFQIRNEWMVNHSARVIAVFNGEKGGTANTIRYAGSSGIEVRVVT